MSDWTPYAQKLKDTGTKGLIWVGEPEGLGGLMGALRDIGYQLDFIRADANHYDRKLIDTAGTALADRNVYVSSAFYPFEQAKPTNATGEYLQGVRGGQARGQEPHLPRAPGVVGLVALREGRRHLRRRPDAHGACTTRRRRSRRGPAAACTPRPRRARPGPRECFALERATPDGVRAGDGHQAERRHLQLQPEEPLHAAVGSGRRHDPGRRRAEHRRT